jgi:uncharacterized protein YbbC (DUF1343 family)
MQAANENGVAFIVLDRPNPLGDYVDGPVLEDDYKSFVGMLPIPIVHGLTVGELAWMIVGESWIDQSLGLHLDVIPCRGYTHHTPYTPPIKPSPNLPNIEAIRLYPSLCFFEATQVSIGRGTNSPFLQIGFPAKKMGSFSFKPRDIKGMQTNPLHEGKKCYGVDLSKLDPWAQKFSLDYIIKWNGKFPPNDPMINNERWFKLLAGNATLLDQIKAHTPEDEIRRSWKPALDAYKIKRKKYLLYPDFE